MCVPVAALRGGWRAHRGAGAHKGAGARLGVWLALGGLACLAAWLRWRYIVQVQPYPDEFVTLLAVQAILQRGLPVLPSGLFYEHGLLFSYMGAAASFAFGFSREVVRAVSLAGGVLTVCLTWWAGRRWASPGVGWLAATLLAISPSAVMWGGRARMYTLLQVWVLLTLVLALEGALTGRPAWRRLAIVAFMGAAFTQLVSVTLVPPLALAMLAAGWLQARRAGEKAWFAGRAAWLEGAGWALVLVGALLVKRLGQPQGMAPLQTTGAGLLTGLAQVVAAYTGFSGDLVASWQAIAGFYTAPESVGLAALALLAGVWAAIRLWRSRAAPSLPGRDGFTLCLGWVLAAVTLEMLLVISQARRDDKYLFMMLPALCLLAADGFTRLAEAVGDLVGRLSLTPRSTLVAALTGLACLVGLVATWPVTAALLARSGPNYDAAFGYVAAHWQDGDQVLTGTPAAAAIYLGRSDYYAMQDDTGGYAYRILSRQGGAVDRWMASPWLATDDELHAVLSGSGRVWLVLERWGLVKEYFPPLTMQRLLAMTEFVREDDGIIVLRSIRGAALIPEQPAQPVSADFDHQLGLQGFTLMQSPAAAVELVLYWQAERPLPYDYSVFVHLRDAAGHTVAQADHLPLAPVYPPTLWPAGQLIRERSVLAIPPGTAAGAYQLWVGVYRLDTLERLPVTGDRSGEQAVQLGEILVD